MKAEKLNALTSLRFFAAASIVVHHSRGYFGIGKDIDLYFPTYQSVCFFFVLSGFILTYVYRSFESREQVKRFFVARIARVWPLHFVTLVLTFIIFQKYYLHLVAAPERASQFSLSLLSNLFLVHAWIPLKEYFWSFNAPSWSISTEFGFYLLFPLLLRNLKKAWKTHLLVSFAASMAIVILAMALRIPGGKETRGIGLIGLININPVVRLFEFCLGMSTALLFDRMRQVYKPGLTKGTAIEMGLIFLMVLFMTMNQWFMSAIKPVLGQAGASWVDNGVLYSPFFAAIILVFSAPRGLLSKWLSRKVFVVLGEISFSIYLLHRILLGVYKTNIASSDHFPGVFSYLYFWAVLLLGSYVLWSIVEKPFRNVIFTLGTGTDRDLASVLFRNRPSFFKGAVAAGLLLTLIIPVGIFLRNTPAIATIKREQAQLFLQGSPSEYRNVHFGDKFLLLGAELIQNGNKKKLRLVWKAADKVKLGMSIGVHFLDKKGKMIGRADYFQSHRMNSTLWVDKGTIWYDDINIPQTNAERLQAVGICMYGRGKLVQISKGPRDWAGKRLLIYMHCFGRMALYRKANLPEFGLLECIWIYGAKKVHGNKTVFAV